MQTGGYEKGSIEVEKPKRKTLLCLCVCVDACLDVWVNSGQCENRVDAIQLFQFG